jgi:hypothetical protein
VIARDRREGRGGVVEQPQVGEDPHRCAATIRRDARPGLWRERLATAPCPVSKRSPWSEPPRLVCCQPLR